MKKIVIWLMAAMMLTLTACGGDNQKPETTTVDLDAFFETLSKDYDWKPEYLVDIEDEMLESYYPGLSEIPAKQLIAKMPLMSAVVHEMVFMQCETDEDAAKAAEILQKRIDDQAGGGAWYPESMEAWERGQVIQHGTYVAMIASAETQDEIVEQFNALFA